MASETPKPRAASPARPPAAAPHSLATPNVPHAAITVRTTTKPTVKARPATPLAVPVAASAVEHITGIRGTAPVATLKPAPQPPESGGHPTEPPARPAAAPSAAPAQPAPASFKLPGAVYSPQLLESVIYDLQYYLDWIRQNQIRKQVGAKPKDEPNHSDETVLVIKTWLAGKPATLEAVEALLEYLKNLKLPEVHIMLAALPNRAQRLTLVDWFRNNTSQELLLSFVADRNLGGGIVVRTPNRVFDFTWKQQLIAGRDKLAGILKRV
jgi:hypothetical protein